MNKWWTIGCAVALLTVGFLGGWYVNGNRLEKQIAELKQTYADQQAKAEEQIRQKEKAYQTEMQQQAEKYQTAVSSANADMDKLRTELKNVQKKNPMPATCRLDAGRLSVIAKARNSANGTGASSR